MSRDDDLATIQEYCQQAAIAAVADLIRAQTGQLVALNGQREKIPAHIPPLHPQLAAITSAPAGREPITVRPAPVSEPMGVVSWRLDPWTLVPLGLGVTALGLLVWAAVEVVSVLGRAAAAVGHAASVAAPSVAGILLLAPLVMLLCRGGGGGRGFSGTFTGRMH